MMNYPNYYSYPGQQYQQPTGQQIGSQDERIWVTGEASALAYLVAPNSFVRLWDSSQSVFYEKRADSTGRPYMETFEYKRRGSQMPMTEVSPMTGGNDYDERIKSIEARIEALEGGRTNDAQ